MTARLSIVIPAHNEATIIGNTLSQLVVDGGDEFEIVVVANGCSDATADVARRVSPAIRVIEITESSKIAALNAGDNAATVFPRVFLDADVTVAPFTLSVLAKGLSNHAKLVGAPRLDVDTAGASWLVRQYYRVWALTDYRTVGHIGSGIYALSEGGRARFGQFPDIIADDRFVQQLFTPSERLTIDATFVVPAPRTFRSLLSRATRIARGNLEIAELYPELAASTVGEPADGEPATAASSGRFATLFRRVAPHPNLWAAFVIYCVGYTLPRISARRLRSRQAAVTWNRDDTTRVSA